MYGTIYRLKVKSGREAKVIELVKEWELHRKPKVKGALGGFLLHPDKKSNEFVGVALFQDRHAYMANADDPEQHRWYMKLRELLKSDPVWEDGEFVTGEIRGQDNIAPLAPASG